jgi:hypothetical protein
VRGYDPEGPAPKVLLRADDDELEVTSGVEKKRPVSILVDRDVVCAPPRSSAE